MTGEYFGILQRLPDVFSRLDLEALGMDEKSARRTLNDMIVHALIRWYPDKHGYFIRETVEPWENGNACQEGPGKCRRCGKDFMRRPGGSNLYCSQYCRVKFSRDRRQKGLSK